MLVRTDPFRALDRWAQQIVGGPGGWSPTIPMDVYRTGDEIVAQFDLPGVAPDAISVDVDRSVLTVKVERQPQRPEDTEALIAERTYGTLTRELFLGESVDAERITAAYDAGVLTVTIPVVQAKRKIKITAGEPAKVTA